MGLGAATGLTATLLALLLLPPVEGTLTSFSLLGEDSTKYGCLTQAYGEQKPESLKEPLEIQFVGSTNDCTTPDESTLNQEDVDKVSGKVAVFRMCSGATSFVDYYRDYFLKTLSLEQSGAVMVIPVEAWIAKLPEHMDRGELTESLNVPICIMELRVFDGLKLLMNEPGVQGDFSSLIFYNVASEPNFDTPITSITVDLNKNDHSFSLPATTSTFNNDTTPAITGTLLPLQLRPECYHSPSLNWTSCVECWSLDRIGNAPGPVLNHDQIMNASTSLGQHVLFVGLEAQGALQGHISTCFSFYYHWAVIGARLLTDAVLIGGLSNTRLAIPGPYLVGTRTVPTFSIINMHSNTFSNLLSEQMEFGNVTVVLPALEKQQGPPFYAPVEQELGITKIGLFDDSPADSGEEDRHFECLAAQATFNPEQYNGSPAPMISRDGEIQAGSTYRVVYVKPSADCGDEATCGRCLSKPTGKLDLDPDVDYGSLVILLHEDDFPCFLSHSEFSQAAVEAGPNALIVAQLGSFSHTVSDSEMARLAFPTFAVDKGCGTRAIDNCDPEASLCPDALYVQLPKLENGVAVGETTTSYTEEGMEPGYIQFASPEALESLGVIPVGTANFNPKDHLSVTAPIALAQTVEICNAQATCVECDRLEWRWKQPPSEFKDRVALFSRAAFDGDHIEISEDGGYVFTNLPTVAAQGKCLLPRGNIVEELQEAGAKGVIFVECAPPPPPPPLSPTILSSPPLRSTLLPRLCPSVTLI